MRRRRDASANESTSATPPSLFDVGAELATEAGRAAEHIVRQIALSKPSAASRVGRASSPRGRMSRHLEPPTAGESEVSEEPTDDGDAYPGGSPRSAIAVSTLTQAARDVVEGAFPPVWVRGEVSDFKAHRNGHWYFCLRDESSQVRCVVWARDQRGIPASPDEGMQVSAYGQLGVYAARGEMQFTVRHLEAEGDGLWRKALDHTRLRLAADGLLAPERKRALPRYPQRIAMVTSASGAALRDVIAVLRRRAPGVEVIVVHAAVQGEGAPMELCSALAQVERWGGADLVIIGRGGGSREDLWAFNDERVARAVAACTVPTISAVGHEVDVTLCDLVADLRAATPSAAAECAVPSREETLLALAAVRRRLEVAMVGRFAEARSHTSSLADRLASGASRALSLRQSALGSLAGRLHALSPLATLARGYAVPSDGSGRTLTSIHDFPVGGSFRLRLADGEVDAVATHRRPAGPGPRP